MIDEYQYVVDWEPEDKLFVARVTEFSSLATHGESQQDALREMRALLKAVISDLKSNGEPVPEPYCLRQYSGKLNLRMPPDLHRKLVSEAEREGVSLNQLINIKLAH